MEEDRVTPSALIHQYDRPAKDSRLPQQIGAALPSLAMLYTNTPLSVSTYRTLGHGAGSRSQLLTVLSPLPRQKRSSRTSPTGPTPPSSVCFPRRWCVGGG